MAGVTVREGADPPTKPPLPLLPMPHPHRVWGGSGVEEEKEVREVLMNPHPETNTGVPPLQRAWEGDKEVTPWGGMKVKGRRRRGEREEKGEEGGGRPKDTPPYTTPPCSWAPFLPPPLASLPHQLPNGGVVQVMEVCEA